MTYAINIGDILHDHDSEPPPGTVIELADGEQWKRLPDTTRWCWAAQHQDYREGVWTWGRVTFDGPVTVVGVETSAS